MWIRKTAYLSWRADVQRLTELLAEFVGMSRAKDQEIATLRTRLERAVVEKFEAEKKQIAASAYSDTFRVRVNQLENEVAALKIARDPALATTLKVPQIETTPMTMPAGVDFDDMGDAAAVMHGLAEQIDLNPLADRAEG